MNNKSTLEFIAALKVRSSLLGEITSEKNNQIISMVEVLKKLDGYALGTKESIEKVEKHVLSQKSDIAKLVIEKKITPEIASFIDVVLNSIVKFSKSITKDSEKLFFAKQGELSFAQQELEKYVTLKKNHDDAAASAEKDLQRESEKPSDQPEKKQIKTRPDKDPTTKVGRAAIDIAERKKRGRPNKST